MNLPQLQGKSIEQLVEMLDGMHPNDAPSVQIREMIDFQLATMQAEASGQLVTSTERLVEATRGLGRATRVLVIGTCALVVVAAVQVTVMWWSQPPSGPRYQIARIDDGTIVRLDTHTGNMRRFVVVTDGDLAAPSEVRIVHEHAAVDGCHELGHVGDGRVGAQEEAAVKGGDTVFYGKRKGGTDEAWAYRCRKAAAPLIP